MGSSILVQQCLISSLQLNLYHHKFIKQNYPPSRTVRTNENKHKNGTARASSSSSSALETTIPSSSYSSASFPLLKPPDEPQDSPASQVILLMIKIVSWVIFVIN